MKMCPFFNDIEGIARCEEVALLIGLLLGPGCHDPTIPVAALKNTLVKGSG